VNIYFYSVQAFEPGAFMTAIPTIDIVDALASEYADKSPSEILELALSQEGEIAISFSGAEDVVLIDMASRLGKPFGYSVWILAGCIQKPISLLKKSAIITTLKLKFVFLKQNPYSIW